MTDYCLDTNTISSVYRFYFRDSFPSFWENFSVLVRSGRAISVSEVEIELSRSPGLVSAVQELKELNHEFFSLPSETEQEFVAEIFSVSRFRSLLGGGNAARGNPVADPFVVAKARASPGMCVVTEEIYRPNAAKIPNVCEHFNIECINLQQMLNREGWQF